MIHDVLIVGGGPAGLSAALALGRARKRVLLCDGGPRRNARAEHIHNFVTRDGTPPDEFRAVGRQQLLAYPTVLVRDQHVEHIGGARGAFEVRVGGETLLVRRVLLCTGMVDLPPAIEGMAELWGHSVFQCPYCHGFEVRDRRFGYLASEDPRSADFALFLRGWTSQVRVFTHGRAGLEAARPRLLAGGVELETRAIRRLVGTHGQIGQISQVELVDGTLIPCDALFTHPPQRQVEVVASLGLALDETGYVKVDAMTRETSIPGVYAGGDLITRQQGAVFAAAAGVHAATMLNHELTADLLARGALVWPAP